MNKLLITVLLSIIATPALAHTDAGAVEGFTAGFHHPWYGLDHLLAMVAVGMLASLKGSKAIWMIPLIFVGMMAAGGVMGVAGLTVPFIELGIIGSIIIFGLLITVNANLATPVIAVIAGFFAIMHGHAHGTEMPVNALGLTYGFGFMLATAMLHGVGIGIGLTASRPAFRTAVRAGGAAICAAGLFFLIA